MITDGTPDPVPSDDIDGNSGISALTATIIVASVLAVGAGAGVVFIVRKKRKTAEAEEE